MQDTAGIAGFNVELFHTSWCRSVMVVCAFVYRVVQQVQVIKASSGKMWITLKEIALKTKPGYLSQMTFMH